MAIDFFCNTKDYFLTKEEENIAEIEKITNMKLKDISCLQKEDGEKILLFYVVDGTKTKDILSKLSLGYVAYPF